MYKQGKHPRLSHEDGALRDKSATQKQAAEAKKAELLAALKKAAEARKQPTEAIV